MKDMQQMMEEQRKELLKKMDQMETDMMTAVQERFAQMRGNVDELFGVTATTAKLDITKSAESVVGVPPLGNNAGSQN